LIEKLGVVEIGIIAVSGRIVVEIFRIIFIIVGTISCIIYDGIEISRIGIGEWQSVCGLCDDRWKMEGRIKLWVIKLWRI